MSTGLILLIVFGCLLGTCTMCGVISAASKSDKSAKTVAAPDPSTEAARRAAEQRHEDELLAALRSAGHTPEGPEARLALAKRGRFILAADVDIGVEVGDCGCCSSIGGC